jgi:hypothetical protein
MRPGVRWLLVGMLAGRVLATSGGACAGHLSPEVRIQATEVELLPHDFAVDRDLRTSEGPEGLEGASHPDQETVAARVEEELVQVSHELDDLTLTTLGQAGRFADRLIRGTHAGATEVHHAYLAVATTLTSLGRCFEAGMATSPFGPAGPRAPDPPSEAGEDVPPVHVRQGQSDPGGGRAAGGPRLGGAPAASAGHRTVIRGGTP